MALTIVKTGASSRSPVAPSSAFKVKITFDSSYPTGGEEVVSGDLFSGEYTTSFFIMPGVATNGTVCVPVEWNVATGKLKVYDMTGAEQTNATDLSTYYVEAIVYTW